MKNKILIAVSLLLGVLSANGQALYQISSQSLQSTPAPQVASPVVGSSASSPLPMTSIGSGSSYSSQLYPIGAENTYEQSDSRVSVRRGNIGGGLNPGEPGKQGEESPIGDAWWLCLAVAAIYTICKTYLQSILLKMQKVYGRNKKDNFIKGIFNSYKKE